jgi:D-alanyl-D-alanine carboxypeptidase-like protein
MARITGFVLTLAVVLSLGFGNSVSAKGASSKTATTGRSARTSRTAASNTSKPTCTPCAAEAAAKSKKAGRRVSTTAKKTRCHADGYVDPTIARNYQNAMRDMKRVGIKPKVTSTWRSSEEQAQLHTCTNSKRCRLRHPGLYKALPPGQSLHEAGMAVDIAGVANGRRGDKELTPRGLKMVRIMQKNGFKWRYGLADPAHFEADPTKHGYRSAAQAIKKSQSTCQLKLLAKAKTKRSDSVRSQSPAASRKSTAQKRVAVKSVGISRSGSVRSAT